MMITIYALKDPDTDQVRYIGQSNNVASRYGNHIFYARNPERCPTENEAYKQWMSELKARGKEPILEVIEEVEKVNAKDIEASHIARFSETCELVNILPFNRKPRQPKRKPSTRVDPQLVEGYRKQAEWNSEFWTTVHELHDEYGQTFLSKMTTEFIVLCRNYANLTEAEKRRLTVIEAWHRAIVSGNNDGTSLRCTNRQRKPIIES